MKKLVCRSVLAALFFPIVMGAISVYTKQMREKEQLVLGEVSAFIQEDGQIKEMPQLILRKHSLFSGYEKWQVEREDTKEVYQYRAGKIVEVNDEKLSLHKGS